MENAIQLPTALKEQNSKLIWKIIGVDMKYCAVYCDIFNYE